MRITRVELTNIKSYKYAAIPLRSGVTAIRGHNGAGKSTVLEAIGWALFDYMPYRPQKQFVRENENAGKVVVSFISALDECEYHVTRRLGSVSEWFVTNPATGERIDSQEDVRDFLRRHMRIDGQIKLDELFVGALGTPQGTLTADFLMTPADRKAKFDRLLQVEEYGAAAKKLGDTDKYLNERESEQAAQIAGLERDAAQLELHRAQRETYRQAQRENAHDLEMVEGEIEQVKALLERLLAAQALVTQREAETKLAEANRVSAEQRLAQATQLLDDSREATRILSETRADHDGYLAAESARAAAQQRAQERDRLQGERHQAAQRHEVAKRDDAHAQSRLDEIAIAEQRINELQQPLNRQTELESVRDKAHQQAEQLRDVDAQINKLNEQRANTERAIAEREREIAKIEQARPLAAARDERRQRVETLQALAATRQQHEQRRAAIAKERAELSGARAKAVEMQARQQENLRRLEQYRPLVEHLPALEQAQQQANQAVSEIEARLRQHRQSRSQSGMGNCPFLQEPCKNIQARGENSLATYFDRMIAKEEQALIPAQRERDAAVEQVTRAQKVAAVYGQLESFREQLAQANEQVATCDASMSRLDSEQREIDRALATAGDQDGLAEAKRLLLASENADKELARASEAQSRLHEQCDRLRELTTDLAEREAKRAELAGAPEAEHAANAELARLGNPREEIAGNRALADARPATEQAKARAQEQLRQCAARLAKLDASLAPFAALDAEINALDATLTRARPGHTRYLQHEQVAGRLAEREREHAAATERGRAATAAAQQAMQALEQARERFNPQALVTATNRDGELRSKRGQLQEARRATESALTQLDALVAKGEEQFAKLELARAEREELRAMQAMLKLFRETIKDAGPLVTQRLLKDISAQANVIFGEIMGDHATELSWQDEYEIILKRGTQTRNFALLSGGEQMAAALATRLALLRRLTGLDLAFFDEPTQNMDAARRSALAEQIRRVRGFDQLIVISHDDTFEQGLDSVIHLEKRGGATEVSDDATTAALSPFADHHEYRDDLFGESATERSDVQVSALFAE